MSKEAEKAYRRGYEHGYGKALDDALAAGAKKGKWWHALARFLDGPLRAWRLKRTSSEDMPPQYRSEPELSDEWIDENGNPVS